MKLTVTYQSTEFDRSEIEEFKYLFPIYRKSPLLVPGVGSFSYADIFVF